jgi:GT2 family glycosyltransferase
VKLCVDYAAYLDPTTVFIAGWVFDPGHLMQNLVVATQPALALSSRMFRGQRPDVSQAHAHLGDDDWGFALLVSLPDARMLPGAYLVTVEPLGTCQSLTVRPDHTFSLEAAKRAIGCYEPVEQRAVLGALMRQCGPSALVLEQPVELTTLPGFVRAHLDEAVRVSSDVVFVNGWLVDTDDVVVTAHVAVGGRVSANILPNLTCFERPDVVAAVPEAKHSTRPSGFAATVGLPARTDKDAATDESPGQEAKLVLVTADGAVAAVSRELATPRSLVELTQPLMAPFNPDQPSGFRVCESCIAPALAAAPRRSSASAKVTLWEFGGEVAGPAWSVIVPLYGRYDFVFYQLSHFAHDPDFARADLIYVVDDPAILDGVLQLCRNVHPVYRVPFRVAHGGANYGYAGANNMGARLARAETLLLLNSDVLPVRPGWLSALSEESSKLQNVGAVAPRLLFEDGTVQHDGMAFYRNPRWPDVWLNDHPGKGLPPALCAARGPKEVPSVTAACMMLSRSLWESAEGLDEGYLLGDFEDSDLCLKLRELGQRNYVVPEITLYHLERKSQGLVSDVHWRQRLTLYNAWRHTQRWGKTLAELGEGPR